MLASSKLKRIDAALRPAHLADRCLFILDDAQWAKFVAALHAAPRARLRLARLMKTGK